MRRIALFSAVFLLLSGCQSAPPNAPAPLTADPVTSQKLPARISRDRAWENFVFDIRVDDKSGNRLPLVDNFGTASRFAPSRLLVRAGSIGDDGRQMTVQTNIGLWENTRMARARASVFIDFAWPLLLGKLPDDLSAGHIQSARLDCAEWAQGLAAANRSDPRALDKLSQSLGINSRTNRDVTARLSGLPYKLGDSWIIPVEVTLDKGDFASNCL